MSRTASSSDEFRALAEDRRRQLKQLAISHPEEALSMINSFAAQPLPDLVRRAMESRVNLEGQISTIVEDDLETHTGSVKHMLIIPDGRSYQLRFVEPGRLLRQADDARVEGWVIDDVLLVERCAELNKG